MKQIRTVSFIETGSDLLFSASIHIEQKSKADQTLLFFLPYVNRKTFICPLPISPEDPKERIQDILENSGAAAVIAQEQFVDLVEDSEYIIEKYRCCSQAAIHVIYPPLQSYRTILPCECQDG